VRERLSIGAGLTVLWLAAGALGCGGGDVTTISTGGSAAGTTPAPTTTSSAHTPRSVGDGEGGIRLERLGEFDQPVYVTQPPTGDDRHLYVVEQCGRIQRLPASGGAASLFLDISDLVTCGGEQGLLSVAFAPDYARSGLLYVDYTDKEGDSRVVEYRRSDDPAAADPASARELVHIADFASNHNGGLLLFGPDGGLYLGMGDGGGGGDPERTAQNPDSPLGKLLRIDRHQAGEPVVVALGLRNPWRYSFDRKTANLWIGDVGQETWEEIDALAARELASLPNFGWSAFEGTERFNSDQQAPGALPPVFEYSHDGGGCSVTGGYVVRDPELVSLYGRYLYGDFCIGDLHSFTADPTRQARDDRALGLRVEQLSSFGEDAAGHLYVVSLAGPVYRLAAAN
jgi:glucose/arabinose dehydrogenase